MPKRALIQEFMLSQHYSFTENDLEELFSLCIEAGNDLCPLKQLCDIILTLDLRSYYRDEIYKYIWLIANTIVSFRYLFNYYEGGKND